MKNTLSSLKCRACEGLIYKLKPAEIKKNLFQIKEWKVKENKLFKEYKFPNFKSSLFFVNKLGKIAEQQGHHPNISFTWGKVEVTIYTHAVNGLTINDFILAAKYDKIK